MNPFDITLLALMAIFALVGAVWGFTRMVAGLAGFVLAFVLGLRFSVNGDVWFGNGISEGWGRLAAFFVVFFGVMLATTVVAFIFRRFLKVIMLGWADRLTGAAIGTLAALLLGAALTFPLTALAPEDQPLLSNSKLAPYAMRAADVVRHAIPDDLRQEYEEKKEILLKEWDDKTTTPSGG